MYMENNILLWFIVCYIYYLIGPSCSESVYYMNTERPVVTYTNPLLIRACSASSRRVSRRDPRHYLNINVDLLMWSDNKVKVDFYFYQLLTNRYKPSFVELHFRLCDLIAKDTFLGSQIRKNMLKLNVTCPYPPGKYNLTDMAAPFVPNNFPFTSGRIYLNVSKEINRDTYPVARGYIDMEIKHMLSKNKKH